MLTGSRILTTLDFASQQVSEHAPRRKRIGTQCGDMLTGCRILMNLVFASQQMSVHTPGRKRIGTQCGDELAGSLTSHQP
jgi:hypothetical protein